jgi:5-methylcytosine-specific restriction endonuclease McrA
MASLPAHIRARVLEREQHRCSGRFLGGECSASLHVHHIIPRNEGGTDELDNLMVLCSRHHPMLESIRRQILRRRAQPRRCNHEHRYSWARAACERRLNRAA